MTCSCCGAEGEDEVAQWCIEEAIFEYYREMTAPTDAERLEQELSPGEQQALDHAARMAKLRMES